MPLKIDWNGMITKVIAGLITAAVIGWFRSQRFREFLKRLLKQFVVAVRWLAQQWRYLAVIATALLLEAALYGLYRDWRIVALSLSHLGLAGLILRLLGSWRHTLRVAGDEAKDLQQVFHGTVGLPISLEQTRIFHAASPCVLPVCFRSPQRLEYTYVVIDTRVEDTNTEDNRGRIVSKPRLQTQDVHCVTVARGRWYLLTSHKPLEWIRFGDGPRVNAFFVVKAEIHPVKTWNKHDPVTVPSDRILAYGLAITEQIGPSTWFVSIDGREYTFSRDLGCHFVEFVLSGGQDHSLSFGYKGGPWGIACAFFAF